MITNEKTQFETDYYVAIEIIKTANHLIEIYRLKSLDWMDSLLFIHLMGPIVTEKYSGQRIFLDNELEAIMEKMIQIYLQLEPVFYNYKTPESFLTYRKSMISSEVINRCSSIYSQNLNWQETNELIINFFKKFNTFKKLFLQMKESINV